MGCRGFRMHGVGLGDSLLWLLAGLCMDGGSSVRGNSQIWTLSWLSIGERGHDEMKPYRTGAAGEVIAKIRTEPA